MISLGYVIIFAITFILYKLYKFIYSEPYVVTKVIPGPSELPIIGNLHQIYGLNQAEFTKKYWDWSREYGSPMRLVFGPGLINVTISKAEHMEVLLKSNSNISKNRAYDIAGEWLGKGLLMTTGQKWFTRRKQLTPAFHFQILNDFIHTFNEQSAILVDILEKNTKHGDHVIDVVKPLSCATLDSICETAMGISMNAQQGNTAYTSSVAKFAEISEQRFRNAFLHANFIFNLTPMAKERDRHLEILHNFTLTVIKEKMAVHEEMKSRKLKDSTTTTDPEIFGSRKKRRAFLDLLLELKDEGKLTLENVREEVDTFMFAGHDTTAYGLVYLLWCLGTYKEVQEKLFQEIDSILGGDFTRAVTSEDLAQTEYMDCVIKETQRMIPSVPMTQRELSEDIYFGKFRVPKGTDVSLSYAMLHRDPAHFPDPLKYDPDRFLPHNAEGRHPFAFVPFAAGPRNCIGQKFALMETKVTLIYILRKFKLESQQSFEELKPAIEFILRPTDGLRVKFTPRLNSFCDPPMD